MSKVNTRVTINANIKQNGNQEITGQVLNSVLNTMVDDYAEQEKLTELESEVSQLGKEVNREAKIGSIIGAGNSFVGPVQICELASNTVYRVKIENWDVTGITPDPTSFLFRLMISVDGGTSQTDLIKVTTNNQLEDEYTVVTPANDKILCYLGGRCAVGIKGIVHIECDYDKTVKYNTCVSAYFTGVKSLSVTNIGNSCTVIFPKDTTLHIRRLMGGNMYSHDFGSTEETYTISYDQTLFYDVANDSLSVSNAGTFNINKIALLSYDGRTFSGVLSSFANKEYSYYVAKQNPISVYFTSIKQPSFSFNNSSKTVTVVLPGNCTMRLHSSYVGTVQSIDLREERTFQVAYDQALYINVNTGNLSVAYSNSSEDRSRITLLSYCGTGLNGPLAGFILGDLARLDQEKIITIGTSEIIELNHESKKFLEQIKAKNNRLNGSTPQDKLLVLLHFSDIHASSRALQRLLQFYSYYNPIVPINDIICTGDIVNNKYSDGINWWDAISGSQKILLCLGNHDVTEGTHGYMESEHTQQELYSRYFAPYIANWGNVQIQENKTYWYKDYTTEKVRVVCVNQFLIGDDDTEQQSWLASVLADAFTNGLSVVGLVHCPPNGSISVDCNFTALDPSLPSSIKENSSMATVHTFINSGGKFICWLVGHVHCDYIVKSDIYPEQLFVAIANAYCGQVDADCERVQGDKSEDCFNIISFNTELKLIKIFRVGVSIDSYMRQRNTICIDYDSQVIVSQS